MGYRDSSAVEKTALSGMLPEEISAVCALPQRFQSLQIFQWIARGCTSFEEMTNLPSKERERLAGAYTPRTTVCETILKDPDGTVKLGIVGCPMGCTFCQTGQLGCLRNLAPYEIVEQFLHLEQICGKLDNIVFMGMGEPLLNLDSIAKTIAVLTHPKGRNLSHRRITLSTSGICKGIYELADRQLDIRLAVSLTTADEALRTSLMPVTKTNPLSELKKAIRYFNDKTDKRVTLELALLKNVNTSYKAAKQVSAFAQNLNVHINLIPWNPVQQLPYSTPSDAEIRSFYNYLAAENLNVTIRQKRGRTIGGACGQLGKKGNTQ